MSTDLSIHDKIVEQIIEYTKESSYIEAVIALGSIGRRDYHFYSDIDLVLINAETSNEQVIINQVTELFSKNLKFQFHFENPTKLVLYLGEDLVKVDLFICINFSQIEILFRGSAIKEPEKAILYDRKGRYKDLLRTIDFEEKIDLEREVKNQLDMFLYAFEAFSNAHRMSDGYRSYFEYNLALHRLVRILYVLRGGRNFLFLPRRIVSDYLTQDEQQIFRALNGQIFLRSINTTKRALLNFFYPILKEILQTFPKLIIEPSIIEYCESIFARDFFWNLRDLGKVPRSRIRENRIYRSSNLAWYVDNPYFQKWIDERGINTIIDLRAEEETQEHPYPEQFLTKVHYVNLPLFKTRNDLLNSTLPLYEFYIQVFQKNTHTLVDILSILTKDENYPVLIHCNTGKDRSGIVAVMIHLLAQTPEDAIIEDYLISDQALSSNDIKLLLEYIKTKGGIRSYFQTVGISHSTLDMIRGHIRLTIDKDGVV